MTAVNVLRLPDSVSIITDTLAVMPNGHWFHTSKCTPIPHLKLAVATRGVVAALPMMVREICANAHGFDTARDFLDRHFRGMPLAEFDKAERLAWQHGVEVFVAGWSSQGPAAFMISTVNTDWRVIDIPYAVCTPTVPPAEFEAFSADPIRNMPALLSAQARADSSVGGSMIVTTISEHEILTYSAGFIHQGNAHG
ncbi:MAG: hypothetical protein DI589_05905 [Shinella sp.]|nr:MAG: hypothetical protein DI589_05905 [Shinella sp.]